MRKSTKKDNKQFYFIVKVTADPEPPELPVFPSSDTFSHGMTTCLCGAFALWLLCPDVINNPLTKTQ